MIKIFTLSLSDCFWGYRMFTITGMFQGRTATVTYKLISEDPYKYNGGTLSGDQAVIEKAHYLNNQKLGSLGCWQEIVETNYLFYEIPARDMIRRHVFESIISEEDDWESYDPDVAY